jgi:hypothetical protein
MIYRIFLVTAFFCLVLPAAAARAQTSSATPTPGVTPTAPPSLEILSPLAGQALQGSLAIRGTTDIPGFQSAELNFRYSHDLTRTWFLIQTMDEPVLQGSLAQWDTTTITDGNYDLRLLVSIADGSQKEIIVMGLRVRNYTPIETNTPTPVTPTATQQPGDTPIPTDTPTPTATDIPPTPTGLPQNPAQVNPADLAISLGKGVLVVVGLFALVGIYQVLGSLRRRG